VVPFPFGPALALYLSGPDRGDDIRCASFIAIGVTDGHRLEPPVDITFGQVARQTPKWYEFAFHAGGFLIGDRNVGQVSQRV